MENLTIHFSHKGLRSASFLPQVLQIQVDQHLKTKQLMTSRLDPQVALQVLQQNKHGWVSFDMHLPVQHLPINHLHHILVTVNLC